MMSSCSARRSAPERPMTVPVSHGGSPGGDASASRSKGQHPMNIGPTELLIVLAIVLLLFGSTKLPKLARSLGEAQKEFKKGVDEGKPIDAKASDGDADKA